MDVWVTSALAQKIGAVETAAEFSGASRQARTRGSDPTSTSFPATLPSRETNCRALEDPFVVLLGKGRRAVEVRRFPHLKVEMWATRPPFRQVRERMGTHRCGRIVGGPPAST